MNSKIFITSLFIVLLFLGACDFGKNHDEHPNIVWITSEDNSKHYMELFDEHGAKTPNIERLAESGLIYTRAFSNAPVCSSARSTLISGCYGPRVASHYHRKLEKVPMPEGIEMFPAYLKAAGYYTTNNSKEDYNFFKSDSVWDDSSNKATWRNRALGQPFFHVFNIGTTHEGSLHFKEKAVKNKPTITNADSVFVQPNHPQTEVFRYTNAYYRDRIMKMDRQVGEVVAELEKDSLLENTFIFYFGDHGGVLPGSKGYLAETGLHVPLVVHVPEKYKHLVNAERGTKVDNFVSFVDFGATVLSLAGVELPEGIDGKPFLGKQANAEEVAASDETYSYAERFDEKYEMVRAIRKGNLKYVRNYQPFYMDGLMNNYRYKQYAYRQWADAHKKGELNDEQAYFYKAKPAEQLFDVEADPFELNNLASDPAYSEKLSKLRVKLTNWVKSMPDLAFYPEHYLMDNAFDNPIKFGQEHKANIESYLAIADLELEDFESVRGAIRGTLKSEDPWTRYWGLIVCSSFGEAAKEFVPVIKEISQADAELINKVRAAEYLGIIGVEDPAKVMTNALYESTHKGEALLIFNCIVLMQDGHNYTFKIEADKINAEVKKDKEINQRMKYFKLL